MIGKRISPDNDLEYLLGNTDSKGRDRTSEVVGGGNLRVIMHMRKYARRYKEPSLTYVYREKRPLSEIGGIEFEEHLKECILKTFFPSFEHEDFYYLFIRHHNPDRSYELNFYTLCMANNRQFTPYLHRRDIKAHKLMGKMLHQENPKLSDPSNKKKLLSASARLGEKGRALYYEVCRLSFDGIEKGIVRTREDLFGILKREGIEIPRQGKDYFTVKRGDTRIRLKGPAAEKTFDIENADLRQSDEVDYRKLWEAENKRRHDIMKSRYKNLSERNIKDYEREDKQEQRHATHIGRHVGSIKGEDEKPDSGFGMPKAGNIQDDRRELGARISEVFKRYESNVGSQIKRVFGEDHVYGSERRAKDPGNGDYEKRDGEALANSKKLCEYDAEPAPDFGLCKSIYEASKIILEIISGITRRKYTPFSKLVINILRGIFEAFGVKPPDIFVKMPAQTAVSREKTEEEKINDGIAFICSKIENKRADDKYMVDFVAKFSVRNNIPIAEMVKKLDMRDSESVLKSFERYKGAYEDRIYGYGPER